MLIGKWWILGDGSVADVSTSEHNIFTKAFLLRLENSVHQPELEALRTFRPLSDEEREHHIERGIDRGVVNLLWSTSDLRPYAILELDWIRISKGNMYVKSLDKEVILRIRSAADFWSKQNSLEKGDMFRVYCLNSETEFDISAHELRGF